MIHAISLINDLCDIVETYLFIYDPSLKNLYDQHLSKNKILGVFLRTSRKVLKSQNIIKSHFCVFR